ncbi:nuclear transport factor 2 family protein [Patulibacter sp. NPDC049589]|uniref:nuclear transport factor 2 family protein n=1 Tax=Patulibacter sp. NPDC049589 TaxID=3154731 RepID=UPI00341C3393
MSGTLPAAEVIEIRNAIALFAHVFDNDLVDDMGLVFSEDMVVESVLGQGYSIPGLEAGKDFLRRRRPETADHHTVDTVLFWDDAEHVSARSRYLAVRADGGINSGDYFDILVKTPEGWRIQYRLSVPRTPDGPRAPVDASFLANWRPSAARLPLRIA